MTVLIPTLILVGIAIVCAALLTAASVFFGVKEDETAVAIRDCLPGANCGACGYSGCDGYAKALAEKSTDKTNLCVPGGDSTAKGIAAVLGVDAADVVEKVAYVACNGTCDVTARKYDYQGHKTCRTANMAYSGDKFCTFACLGYGDCAVVCPQGAISVENGVARVDPRKCIGCGICVRECPNGIIHLINDTSRVVVECSNKDKGKDARGVCEVSCIGCGMCEKVCTASAIKVVNNVAVIDDAKCLSCGMCAVNCPRGAIIDTRGVLTPKF